MALLNTRYPSPTDQKPCGLFGLLTILLLVPPGKSLYTVGEIAKYEAMISIYIYIYRYNPLDNQYEFSISIGNTDSHVATLTLDILQKIC